VRVRVEVTEEDIRRGKRNTCTRCPVARALRRSGVISPSVYHSRAIFGRNGQWWGGDLPQKVTDFICAFDDREPVKPFSFVISVPAKAVRR